jgi:hypothetical protein
MTYAIMHDAPVEIMLVLLKITVVVVPYYSEDFHCHFNHTWKRMGLKGAVLYGTEREGGGG